MVDIDEKERKTIKQFIEELQQYPEDTIVFIREQNYWGKPEHFDYSPGIAYNQYTKEAQIVKE